MLFGNYIKDMLLLEGLKISVKHNIKNKSKKVKEKYKKSELKKAIDGVKEKYENSTLKEKVSSGIEIADKKLNGLVYYAKNGEFLEDFKEIEMNFEEVYQLLQDKEYCLGSDLKIQIIEKGEESFNGRVYKLSKYSVMMLMKEHFYKNDFIQITAKEPKIKEETN